MATKVFVDTNIILDLFDNKRPFHKDSVALYQCVEDNLIEAFISETVLATTDYILQKNLSKNARVLLFTELIHSFQILPCSNTIFEKAVKSNFEDLEDSILYHISLENKLDYFATNDTKAIKNLSSKLLPAMRPRDLLKLIS